MSTSGREGQGNTVMGKERQDRRKRLEQFTPVLRNKKMYEMPIGEMIEIMKMYKEEGNDLFKEKKYSDAGEYYTHAITLACTMEKLQGRPLESELVSSVFCNRATCLHKMELYHDAIDNCNMGLALNNKNVKAYFRKASALRMLGEYKYALVAAEEGRRLADNRQRSADVKEFDDLLEVIVSSLGDVDQSRRMALQSDSFTQWNTKWPERPSNFREMLWSGQWDDVTSITPPTTTATPVVTKAATASASVLTDSIEPKVDESWLVGTNAQIPKKPAEKKVESKKNGTNGRLKADKPQTNGGGGNSGKSAGGGGGRTNGGGNNSATSKYHKYLSDVKDMVSDSSEDGSDADDMTSSDTSPSASSSDDEMKSASEGHLSSDEADSKSTTTATTTNTLSNDVRNSEIGNSSEKSDHPVSAPPVSAASKPTASRPFNDVNNVVAANRRQKEVVARNDPANMGLDDFGVQAAAAPPPLEKQNVRSSASSEQQDKDNTQHKPPGLPVAVNIPRPQMPPPFGIKYHFTLACRQCFEMVAVGVDGFVYKDRLNHSCMLEFLLVKDKTTPGTKWVKIRPLPHINYNNFTGKFRLCNQFGNGLPCKIGEPQCTFAHNEPECELWMLELNGLLSLGAFVQDQRRYRVQLKKAKAATQEFYPPSNNYPQHSQRKEFPHQGQGQPFQAQGQQQQQQQYQQQFQNRQPPRFAGGDPRKLANEQGEQYNTQKYDFPLAATHEFKMACPECCHQSSNILGIYQLSNQQHQCKEDIFMIRKKGEEWWVTVRERRNHRYFPGDYAMCIHYTGSPPKPCTVGVEFCAFAHNKLEQYLWTMEKDGDFSVQEFILQNRSERKQAGFTLDDFFDKHGGIFRFICNTCFYNQPCRISMQSESNPEVCNGPGHVWVHNKLLLHINHQKKATPIDPRPFTHNTAFFLVCHKLNYCRRRAQGECRFAHSQIERDLWLVERDSDMTRDQLVEASTQFYMNYLHAQTGQSPPPSSGVIGGGAAARGPASTDSGPSYPASTVSLSGGASGRSSVSSALDPREAALAKVMKPPFRVIEVCGLCLKRGHKATQEGSKDRCNSKTQQHNNFLINRAYLILPSNKELRKLPTKIPANHKFIICQHVRERKKCTYKGVEGCQFAHSDEEKDMWAWMSQNNVKSLEQVGQICKKAHEAAIASSKLISQGQSVVTAKPTTMPTHRPRVTPIDLIMSAFYCKYCSVQCNSQKQWDEHCASEKHMFNLNSDKEHQWNFRPPPWGVSTSNYQLCADHANEGHCRYSDKPDMYNYCKFAHSSEELDEWKERWEWRQMKREIAKKEQVYSYMEALLEDYEEEYSGINVISEQMEGVQVDCATPLGVYEQNKNVEMTWTFVVKPKKGEKLEKVSLLHNKDRLHYSLIGADLDKYSQIAPGASFLDSSASDKNPQYKVEVKFTGGMFGSFMQWVTFDFGSRPVLVRKLNVELGVQIVHEKVQQLRKQLDFFRWSGDNREIIRFDENGSQGDQLLLRYKAPTSADMVITQQSIGVELNRHNYVHKMHKLLQLEELTRHQIISSYNLKVYIELQNRINESTLVCARPGELFARVPLEGQLSDDTDAGKLILSSVFNILIAPHSTDGNKVYEAVIVQKENFNFDGKGKDYIYLCLSPRCVKDLGLRSNQTIGVEIQFQMNRLPFCQMHHAVDQLEDTDVVFPDLSKIRPNLNEMHSLVVSSDVLNDDQMKIVRHVMADRIGYSPPMIIYGPFGTGKTETMAQSAMLLMKERPQSRILICTHSNSAADLYILKHLDAYVNTAQHASVLRMYSTDRRVNTVPMVVQKYCLFRPGEQGFEAPTREDIVQYQIVITTLSTSLQLSHLNLKGHFTHIFLDEAAQAFECETIMPLSLANDTTCIVMAGDHMQISPKVYSSEAQRQKFQKSLLERLFRHYESYSKHLDARHPLNVLLSQNYRSKMEILRFISAIFYGGPDRLRAKSVQPAVDGIVALNFYVAQGQEYQEREKTSFYNASEIEEITARVEELYNRWPEEWGEPQADAIGVVTPYYDQVLKIRTALRQRKKALRDVVVERVMNMQGKEFRALFISTVRTRHLIENPLPQGGAASRAGCAECDGEGSDFGFLSDQKLLNTALTRARSYVAVVGDPVALCCIGDCTTIWRTYLKHCQQMGSIHPRNITMDLIRTHVISLMNSPHGGNLSRLANVGAGTSVAQTPSAARGMGSYAGAAQISSPAVVPDIPMAKALGEVTCERQPGGVTPTTTTAHNITPSNPSQNIGPIGQPVYAHGPLPPMSQVDDFDDKELELRDYALEGGYFDDAILQNRLGGDEILKQLAKRAYRVQQKTHPTSPRTLQTPVDFKLENIKVVEMEQQAVIQYKTMNVSEEPEYSADKHAEPRAILYRDYGPEQFKELIVQRPDKYKRCILYMEDRRIFARVVDMAADLKEIKINGIGYCGGAFAKDEVVVEVETQTAEEVESKTAKGQVVGIVRRNISPAENLLVCAVDGRNASLLTPLNRDVPKMLNLINVSQVEHVRLGQVCVYRINETQIKPHHYEPVANGKADRKLFVVQHIGTAKSALPVCVVVGVLQGADSVDALMKVMSIEYPVQTRFNADALMELNAKFPEGQPLPRVAFANRVNYKERETFILKSPIVSGQNMALSIELLQDNNLLLGVHTIDMTYFVKAESQLDNESHERATTVTVDDQPVVSMLPERLRSELCAVKIKEEVITISVFLSVNQVGEVQKVQPARCVIQPKFELSYEEAEEIICGRAGQSPHMIQIFMLHKIAQMWRKKRLGIAAAYETPCTTLKKTPNAYQLMEEVTTTVNCIVAQVLLDKFPDRTPLLRQLKPSDAVLKDWKDANMQNARNSVALLWPFMERASNENVVFPISSSNDESETVGVLLPQWDRLVEAIDGSDVDQLQQIVTTPDNIPLQGVAKVTLDALTEEPRFICSSEGGYADRYYKSLTVPLYIRFTMPLHNYMDIVVQRLLTTVIDNRKTTPHSESEMETIAGHQTKAMLRAQRYARALQSRDVLTYMQCRPVTIHPYVQKLDGFSVQLRYPVLSDLLSDLGEMLIGHLGVTAEVTLDDVTRNEVTLRWQQRIYDANGEKKTATSEDDVAELNPRRWEVAVPAALWRELLSTFNKDDRRPAIEAAAKMKAAARVCAEDEEFAEDRMSSLRHQHYAHLTLPLAVGGVLRVQLAAHLEGGILRPRPQLVSLTSTLDVCLEHRRSPARCFVKRNGLKAGKLEYDTDKEYRNAWRNEIEADAVHEAVRGESIVIHNVALNWLVDPTDSTTCTAMFHLPVQFCLERMIRFESNELKFQRNRPDQCLGYVCVRYKDLTVPSPVEVPPCLAEEFDASTGHPPVCWVGHCAVTGADVDPMTGQNAVKLRLINAVIPLPEALLTSAIQQPQMCATVEWMPKSLLARRVELALDLLEKSSPLAKDIAVGKLPPALDENSYKLLQDAQEANPPALVTPDATQSRAIDAALRHRFAVLRGCAATGKTVTAVRLAQLFVEANRTVSPLTVGVKKGMKPQVLICAATERSLDVIAGYLKQLGQACPKLIRVYSEDIEKEEFPLPMDPIKPESLRRRSQGNGLSGGAVSANMRDIALHHIIREEDCVREENRRLAGLLKDATTTTQYILQLLTKLQHDELCAAEVVLCTCVTSGDYRILQSTHIRQVIFDDAGMCLEPECMIPIIYSGAQQVMLVGDEKELRPWPRDGSVRQENDDLPRWSLLQRYATRAQVFLNCQYRMHESIAAFPSEHFYSGLMVHGREDQSKPSSLKIWPNGKNKPIAFVHVAGEERFCTAFSPDGHVPSVSNPEQVLAAVKIVQQLTLRSHVRPKDIVVLAPYLTQCADIRKALAEKSSGDVEVLPITQSQGFEWDYTILCTVRSKDESDVDARGTADWQRENLGVLTDERLVNTALTRAKKGLIIVGNKHLLRCNPMWKSLLRHYDVNKKVLDLHEFMAQK